MHNLHSENNAIRPGNIKTVHRISRFCLKIAFFKVGTGFASTIYRATVFSYLLLYDRYPVKARYLFFHSGCALLHSRLARANPSDRKALESRAGSLPGQITVEIEAVIAHAAKSPHPRFGNKDVGLDHHYEIVLIHCG